MADIGQVKAVLNAASTNLPIAVLVEGVDRLREVAAQLAGTWQGTSHPAPGEAVAAANRAAVLVEEAAELLVRAAEQSRTYAASL